MNPKDLSLQLCPEHFICRIAAGTFLHAALNTVCGISPVFIFVPVVIFFYKPCDFFLQAFHIFLHQCKCLRVKFPFLRIVQFVFRSLDQIPEMRQAKSFALFKKLAEFFIFQIQVEKGIQISAIDFAEMIADIAVRRLFGDPCAKRGLRFMLCGCVFNRLDLPGAKSDISFASS